MKERKRPPWLRWVMLIVALGLCWAIWDDMELYARLEEQAIFSPAEREQILTEARFGKYLFSAGVPDPDLIIRPSGEERISNFLLWQSAYAEYYFTDILWPDFNRDELHRALAAYQHRQRRFGGVING